MLILPHQKLALFFQNIPFNLFRISYFVLRIFGQRPANWLCFFNLDNSHKKAQKSWTNQCIYYDYFLLSIHHSKFSILNSIC